MHEEQVSVCPLFRGQLWIEVEGGIRATYLAGRQRKFIKSLLRISPRLEFEILTVHVCQTKIGVMDFHEPP